MALPKRAPSILMGFLRMLFPKQVCYQGNKLCCHPKMWGTQRATLTALPVLTKTHLLAPNSPTGASLCFTTSLM